LIAALRSIVERDGWHLLVAENLAAAPELISIALTAESNGPPLRRSRHGVTFQVRASWPPSGADIFVKYFDSPRGWERLKSYFRQTRSAHVQRITAQLHSADFVVPEILLRGIHHRSRRELLVTARVSGEGPLMALRSLGGSIEAKRALLRALGGEVARLHRAGFVHGDLTPFNLRVVAASPLRFVFLDNEGTRRKVGIGGRRHRLRNLVQLGRFPLPGISRTDRLRVCHAYQAALYGRYSRSLTRKAAAMLERRLRGGEARAGRPG